MTNTVQVRTTHNISSFITAGIRNLFHKSRPEHMCSTPRSVPRAPRAPRHRAAQPAAKENKHVHPYLYANKFHKVFVYFCCQSRRFFLSRGFSCIIILGALESELLSRSSSRVYNSYKTRMAKICRQNGAFK